MRSAVVRFGALLGFVSAACGAAPAPSVVDGDLLFQTSRSAQSAAIQKATGSRYSHMGVVLTRNGRAFVFEAERTVRYTPLETWLARGERGHYVLKRPRTPLTAAQVDRLREEAKAFEGKPYDAAFEWSDRRLYCSELVWKLYDRALGVRLGERAKLGDFALDDPLVRAKLRERYGKNIPLDETVISPQAMFASPLLETVAEQ
ncbi:YiiX family permuted papain-like enzyme [Dokdonella sp.]|uniref:YiiX family permuted papain-like enzyme n=1 Tax=Dokdonella sp. TaxID=2291710 RepID=UPI001B263246|nr:YiiX family permuted papain-like enzyme [Dokdonella sp.]MBO9662227.1 YiiX family permuted papain-like enzyme [Dokdonella sp.]